MSTRSCHWWTLERQRFGRGIPERTCLSAGSGPDDDTPRPSSARPPWLGLCAKRMAGRGEAGWTPRAQRRPGRALRGVLRPPPRARGQRWASLPGGPAASPAPDSVFSANPLDSPCAAMGCLPPSPGPGGAWCVAGAHWVPVSESRQPFRPLNAGENRCVTSDVSTHSAHVHQGC